MFKYSELWRGTITKSMETYSWNKTRKKKDSKEFGVDGCRRGGGAGLK